VKLAGVVHLQAARTVSRLSNVLFFAQIDDGEYVGEEATVEAANAINSVVAALYPQEKTQSHEDTTSECKDFLS
jgi:hypothetical protein